MITSTSTRWTPGGHGLLWALPRSYQVTPDIPDRRRATQQKEVRPPGRQPQRESARRPVGTFSSAADITDNQIRTASLEGAARLRTVRLSAALPSFVLSRSVARFRRSAACVECNADRAVRLGRLAVIRQ